MQNDRDIMKVIHLYQPVSTFGSSTLRQQSEFGDITSLTDFKKNTANSSIH